QAASSFRSHLAQVMVPLRVTSFFSSAWAAEKTNSSATAASIDHAVFIAEPPVQRIGLIRVRPPTLSDGPTPPLIHREYTGCARRTQWTKNLPPSPVARSAARAARGGAGAGFRYGFCGVGLRKKGPSCS